jgi:hypothetical protein
LISTGAEGFQPSGVNLQLQPRCFIIRCYVENGEMHQLLNFTTNMEIREFWELK